MDAVDSEKMMIQKFSNFYGRGKLNKMGQNELLWRNKKIYDGKFSGVTFQKAANH